MTEITSEPVLPHKLFADTFEDFSLPESILLGLKDLGYVKPTFVQQSVFEAVRSGRDIVVQSHTGSGKTTAFCLPLLSKIDPDLKQTQVLVLAPTRELAKQVAMECSRLSHHHNVRVSAIYGGASFEAQVASLQAGSHIVIGTPGRVKDLLFKKIFDTSFIKSAVLDEADEMLSMGFWEDVTFLLQQLSKDKQTLFFSATIPPAIENTINSLLKDPIAINLSSDHVSAKTIKHLVHLEDEEQPKSRNLLYALEFHQPKHAIIFCNTKDETDLLERYLRRFGFHARALNGDMSQSSRERVMHDVKNGTLDMIIATDIAARGIDISGLTHVFNYELPENDEVYVHRTGRTGRIGSLGTAVSLVRGKDMTQLANLRQKFEIDLQEQALPAACELMRLQAERLVTALTEEADSVEFSQYLPVAKSMLQRPDMAEVLAFMLRNFYVKNAENRVHTTRPEQQQAKLAKPLSHPQSQMRTQQPRQLQPSQAINLVPKAKEPPAAPAPRIKVEARKGKIEVTPALVPEKNFESEFTKLYITLGWQDGIADLTQLVHHLSIETGVDIGHFTGMGNVRDTSSHVEVDAEIAEKIIHAMDGRHKVIDPKKPVKDESSLVILCEVAKLTETKSKPRFKNQRKL
jgi:ATP-dependent RNA helicase DeaD